MTKAYELNRNNNGRTYDSKPNGNGHVKELRNQVMGVPENYRKLLRRQAVTKWNLGK